MNFIDIRNRLNLSQEEIAILFGISVKNIMNWEQGRVKPDGSAITLYKLVEIKDKSVLIGMIEVACRGKYENPKDIKTLKSVIAKLITNSFLLESLENIFFKNNPHHSSV